MCFRILLGIAKLRSTKFTIKKYKDKFKFLGHGWGHGVGMCQWGAKKMAGQGKKYSYILKYYYRSVKLIKLDSLKSKINK